MNKNMRLYNTDSAAGAGGAASGSTGAAGGTGASGTAAGTQTTNAQGAEGKSNASTLDAGLADHWSRTMSDLPDDLRGHASLVSLKTPADAVKSLVNAQKLIGAKGIPEPKDWNDPVQVKEFMSKLPETYRPPATEADYKFGAELVIDEKTKVPLDKGRVDAFRKMSHELGLTQKQAETLLNGYGALDFKLQTATLEGQRNEAQAELNKFRDELGNQYDTVIAEARLGLANIGDEALQKVLQEKGLLKSSAFIKAMQKVGKVFQEDVAHNGSGSGGFSANTKDGAQLELNRLKSDPEFIKVLDNRSHPGHTAAVEKWTKLNGLLGPKR